MAQKITLTVDDYLYLEALGADAGLGISERSPFLGVCSSYVQHQDQPRFLEDVTTEFGFEDRDALEIAEAIRSNVINLPKQPGEPDDFDDETETTAPTKLGVMPSGSLQRPAQQGQVRIPAQQQRPAQSIPSPMSPMPQPQAPRMTTPIQQPSPMPPQPARELPKIPAGFTAFGPLNLKQSGPTQNAQPAQTQTPAPQQQQTQKNIAPQISVYSQKNISAPSSAVFPSNQAGQNNAPNNAQGEAPAKPPAQKSYGAGKDPYRETFE